MTDVELKPCPFCGGEASLDMASTWQPIETAPKDRTRVLVFVGEYGVMTARYDIYSLRGWVENSFVGEGASPTHWMPLPPEPGQ